MAAENTGEIAGNRLFDAELPFKILSPAVQTVPMVFASPHSGTEYDPSFIAASKLSYSK